MRDIGTVSSMQFSRWLQNNYALFQSQDCLEGMLSLSMNNSQVQRLLIVYIALTVIGIVLSNVCVCVLFRMPTKLSLMEERSL